MSIPTARPARSHQARTGTCAHELGAAGVEEELGKNNKPKVQHGSAQQHVVTVEFIEVECVCPRAEGLNIAISHCWNSTCEILAFGKPPGAVALGQDADRNYCDELRYTGQSEFRNHHRSAAGWGRLFAACDIIARNWSKAAKFMFPDRMFVDNHATTRRTSLCQTPGAPRAAGCREFPRATSQHLDFPNRHPRCLQIGLQCRLLWAATPRWGPTRAESTDRAEVQTATAPGEGEAEVPRRSQQRDPGGGGARRPLPDTHTHTQSMRAPWLERNFVVSWKSDGMSARGAPADPPPGPPAAGAQLSAAGA